MTATLQSIAGAPHRLQIAVGDDPAAITLHYTMGRLTPRLLKEILALAARGEPTTAAPQDIDLLVTIVKTLVVAWDLCPAAGEPVIPLTTVALEEVDIAVLALVVGALMTDLSPKAATTTASSTPCSAPATTKSA